MIKKVRRSDEKVHKKDNEEVNSMKEELRRKVTEVLKQSNICGRDENLCQLSKK